MSDALTTNSSTAGKRQSAISRWRKELGILALLIVVCMATWYFNHRFTSAENMQNLARQIGLFGIFSIGAGLVIISGGIDLSVGSMFAFEGVLFAMALSYQHWPHSIPVGVIVVLTVLAMLALPMLLGWLHGAMITRIPLQPFIVTLCGLMIYRGLARFVSGDTSQGFGDDKGIGALENLATGSLFGVPAPFVVLMIVSLIIWIVLHRSVYGRHLYAVGRNEEAARYSGLNSKRIMTGVYILSGLLTAIAGILFAFYTNSIQPSNMGSTYELYGIAAAVVGGCSLRGGEGSVFGIVIGTALLQVLQNLVNLLGIPSALNFAVMGAVILLGVIADELFKRRGAKA